MLKYNFKWALLLAAVAIAFTACEDPETTFDPVNPDLTEEAILGTSQSANRTIAGLERQMVELMGEYLHVTEIASDNYVNTQTFFNQFVDDLNIDSTDDDIDDAQFELARFRELALFGLNRIGPADPGYTTDQEAEFQFFLGMAYLLGGELFRTLPGEPGGAPLPASTHLTLAADAFQAGADIATDPVTIASCQLARARALYRLGDQAGAVAAANAAIGTDPTFVRVAVTDNLNSARTDNEMQNAIHDRGTFDDLQPLPRLDFLDPKYNDDDATKDMDIPILKIEEAHLILCEAAIADGQLPTAQAIMKDIINLVSTRPTITFDDAIEDRSQLAPRSRPDTAIVSVAASASDMMRPGLVLNRKSGPVTVPFISGTSVTEAMVDAVGTEDEALELLYLMRQEIFIAEGRRMTDMGITFVVSQTEELANINVKPEDVTPDIPPFIESIRMELDAISYTPGETTCTITHNVNAIIVANKTSDYVCPFH